jgi:hypothetical protein
VIVVDDMGLLAAVPFTVKLVVVVLVGAEVVDAGGVVVVVVVLLFLQATPISIHTSKNTDRANTFFILGCLVG